MPELDLRVSLAMKDSLPMLPDPIMGEALEAVSEALEYEGVRARSIELRMEPATEDSTVVMLRASRDLREAGGESSSTPRPWKWLTVDELGVWEPEASISFSLSLSLLLNLIEFLKKLLKYLAFGFSLGSIAGS